jgi:hypothetical protein
MTFDPNIPNAGQSPGLFPPQNNTNFARIKTIINSDHVFNDTAQSTDGFHKQATMIARASPVALPTGSNAILYSWLDGSGQTQLRFYNGANDFQITPIVNTGPVKVTGIVNVTGDGLSGAVYTIPTNTFLTIFVNYTTPNSGNKYRYYMIYNSGGFNLGDLLKESPNTKRPAVEISGGQIFIRNGESSARNIAYYIISVSV